MSKYNEEEQHMIDTVALKVLGGFAAAPVDQVGKLNEQAEAALNVGEAFIKERRTRKALWETPDDEKGTE